MLKEVSFPRNPNDFYWDKCIIRSMKSNKMPNQRPLDPVDAQILAALDDDPRASILHIASALGISRNTVHARLQRFTREGILEDFSHRISPAVLGLPLLAFMSLAIHQRHEEEVVAALKAIPEVIEVHFTTGDADLLLRIAARTTADLHRVASQILATPGITRSSTAISLGTAVPYRTRPLLERMTKEHSQEG